MRDSNGDEFRNSSRRRFEVQYQRIKLCLVRVCDRKEAVDETIFDAKYLKQAAFKNNLDYSIVPHAILAYDLQHSLATPRISDTANPTKVMALAIMVPVPGKDE
jgi:hypothetical protein